MTNSSQHDISLVAEADYGVTPATPVLKRKNITGTTLAITKGTIQSETIDPNRQVKDVRHGNRQVGGELAVEFAYGGFDDLLEAVLCGTWSPRLADYVAATLSAAAADNSINDAANGIPDYAVGERVTIAGFTGTAGNNQTGTVVSRTASKLVLTTDTPLVNDAAGESVTLSLPSNRLVPGATRRSFSVLRNFTNLAGSAYPFHLFKGVELNTFALTIAPEAIVKATFGCLGQDMIIAQTAPTGATYSAASSNKGIDSFNGSIKVDDVEVGFVTEVKLSLENGLEPRFVVFDDKTVEPKIGKTRVTGSLTLYFQDSTFLQAFLAGTRKSIEFTLVDELGNAVTFLLPSVLGTSGQVDAQGEADITIPFAFSAIYDPAGDPPDALVITREPVA